MCTDWVAEEIKTAWCAGYSQGQADARNLDPCKSCQEFVCDGCEHSKGAIDDEVV